jgi:iron complex outermembrane receptor protein
MYIRGVGTNSNSPNNEPAVATYIDGVYDPSPYALATTYFNNIQQISVLKGPQGTLFGRDSTGGVVQIATADPKQAFGGNASIGYANYDTVDGSAYLTGGITKGLAADLAVIYHNQGTGWGYDAPFDTRINWRHNTAARSKWLYTPADTTKVTVALDYSNFTSDGANNQLLPGSFASSDHITTFPGNYNAEGTPNVFDSQEYGASATIDQLIGSLHAVSITSYRNVHGHWLTDSDDTANPFLEVLNFNDADYVTQELRLNNQNPGVVKWQVGAFFFGDNVHVDPYTLFGTKEPGGFEAFYGNQATRSASVFGQATVKVAERTHLTVGTRFTDETLRAYGDDTNSQQKVISGPFYSEVSYRPWTWRASLDHQFTEQVLGYVSYDHGFSSGGYNLTSPGSPAFLPETVNAYEMGMKDEFLNHRVRLNAAAFYYDYKNLQVAVIPGNATQIFTNAAAARNYGTDADLDFAVTDDLTLSASASWLNAKYVNYPFAEGWTPLGAPIHVANASGKELPFSPPFASSVSANYRVPTRMGAFAGQLNVSYHDRYYVSPTEEPVAPVYFLLNASVSWWSNASEPLGIRLWGENLLGAYYPANLLSSSIGWYGAYAAPRTYGITLTKDF